MIDVYQLEQIARRIRRDVIQMIAVSRSGHIGGALGIAELMAVLYFEQMRHSPANPDWEERDLSLINMLRCRRTTPWRTSRVTDPCSKERHGEELYAAIVLELGLIHI